MLDFIYYCFIYEEFADKPGDDYLLRVTGSSVAR